ncbi:hypothetical protein [Mycobacterium lacus]|uniref:hypothetical protein n=1 Tax=Mycobacterium lacus TaxID=169765 RepID=UPI0038B3A0B4
MTDPDADALAWQFLKSAYADNSMYRDWPLDRRLEGYLRRRGLVRLAEDGDAYDLILNRVMSYIGSYAGSAHRSRADERPAGRGLRSLPPTGTDWSDGPG